MVLVYTFNQQITASENIPPQRREVVVVQVHIKIFELPLFSWDSLEDIIRNSKITGARAETVDIFPVVHLYIFIVAEETVLNHFT